MTIKVEWIDRHRRPQCPPDPQFPEGFDIDLTNGREWCCPTPLPYPAKGVGLFMLSCDLCGLTIAITTAGRPDDPRSVKLPCLRKTSASRRVANPDEPAE